MPPENDLPNEQHDDDNFDPAAELTAYFKEQGLDPETADLSDLSDPPSRPADTPPADDPPAEPPAEPPAQDEPPADEPPAADQGILDYIRQEFGDEEADRLNEKYKGDEAEILKGLYNAQRLVGKRDDDAAFGRQFRELQPQFNQYLAQQQGNLPPAAAPPQYNPYLPPQAPVAYSGYPQPQYPPQYAPPPGVQVEDQGPPQFDPRWNEELSVNEETGKIEGPSDLVEAYEEYQRYRRNRSQQLLTDGLTREEAERLVQERSSEIVGQALRQQFAQYQDQQEAHKFLEQNKDWLFEGGDYRVVGGQLQAQFTPSGRQYANHLFQATQEAQYYGIRPEHQSAWAQETARQRLEAETARWYMSQGQQYNQNTPNASAVQQKPPARPNTQPLVNRPSVSTPPPEDDLIREGETLETAMARQIRDEYGDQFPDSFEDLVALEAGRFPVVSR